MTILFYTMIACFVAMHTISLAVFGLKSMPSLCILANNDERPLPLPSAYSAFVGFLPTISSWFHTKKTLTNFPNKQNQNTTPNQQSTYKFVQKIGFSSTAKPRNPSSSTLYSIGFSLLLPPIWERSALIVDSPPIIVR